MLNITNRNTSEILGGGHNSLLIELNSSQNNAERVSI